MFFLATMVSLVVLTSCSNSKSMSVAQKLQREWMVKTLPGVSYEALVASKTEINLSNPQANGAYAGCNRIFFTTKKGKGNKISFTNMGSTKMFCQETMYIEDALTKALSEVASYELDGHTISFKDAKGNVLLSAVAADWD